MEQTISELQQKMSTGELTSLEITEAYLERIRKVDGKVNAVIELNPDAESIAYVPCPPMENAPSEIPSRAPICAHWIIIRIIPFTKRRHPCPKSNSTASIVMPN